MGLTPKGLVEGLRQNPRALWPIVYADLEHIQLPPRVIEWLELLVGEGHDPKKVVKAFLEVLSGFEFSLRQSVHAALASLKTSAPEPNDPLVDALVARIRESLDGITADEWPVAVMDYAEERAQT